MLKKEKRHKKAMRKKLTITTLKIRLEKNFQDSVAIDQDQEDLAPDQTIPTQATSL